MKPWIGVFFAAGIAMSRPAHADHGGMVMSSDSSSESTVGASVSMLAAEFSSMYYAGSYQGVVPAVQWSRDRFSAFASMAMYRLEENGGPNNYGVGDAMFSGQAALVREGGTRGGLALAVTTPTGDSQTGFGMGHVMVMPSLWASQRFGDVTLSASGGFSRAIATLEDEVHGMPLVDPMNMSEISWGASADLKLDRGIHLAARLAGGVPVGGPGIDRAIGGVRVAWGSGNVSTGAELQAGLVGDPFTVRGVVDTALRF